MKNQVNSEFLEVSGGAIASVGMVNEVAGGVKPEKENEKTGEIQMVWGKSDFLGNCRRMALKRQDRIVNRGEIVKDPETGLDVYLIRVYRGKEVFYSKAKIHV